MGMPDRKPVLDNVTLVAVTSVALEPTIRALQESMRMARFGSVLLISHRPPPRGSSAEIRWQEIEPITSRAHYSAFMLRDLHRHVRTSHALCIQWDGYVLDGGHWQDNFLTFDYVGAPWPHFGDGLTVGNGGFSLRSRRLMEATAHLDVPVGVAEDVAICRLRRRELEDRFNIIFAPEDVARQFAYERFEPRGEEFGFHGAFNMPDIVGGQEMRWVFSRIEPHLLTNLECRQLLRWALRHREARLACQIWRHWRSASRRS